MRKLYISMLLLVLGVVGAGTYIYVDHQEREKEFLSIHFQIYIDSLDDFQATYESLREDGLTAKEKDSMRSSLGYLIKESYFVGTSTTYAGAEELGSRFREEHRSFAKEVEQFINQGATLTDVNDLIDEHRAKVQSMEDGIG